MDRFHRELKKTDTPMARICDFCARTDPQFILRPDQDRLVHGSDSATHHLTEDGHIRHRLLEVGIKQLLPRHNKHVHPAA
jgi:hypothetical protein